MIKAIVINETGGPEVFRLEERAETPLCAGEIAVDNTAIGLNFIDIYQRKGLYPLAMPAVLGSEGAGRVAAVGEGVTGFKVGDRVAYMSGHGAYQARTNVLAGMAVKLPAAISDDIAGAVFLKGLTADMLVKDVFPLKAEHTALIYAAAGGVGSILVQWAAKIGATVIAVVGEEKKAALVKDYGAKHVIIRTSSVFVTEETRRLTNGRGVDVVYDSVGAATFEASLNALAMRGMMVSYGNASGAVPSVTPLELTRRGSLTLARPSLFHYATPDRIAGMAANLFSMISSGAIRIATPTAFPLERAAEAHRLLESGASTGSIILKP
jgi:NADPH2:quinone reductase